jgi:hypothetical protein
VDSEGVTAFIQKWEGIMADVKVSDSFKEFVRSIDEADEADLDLKKLRHLLDTKFKDKPYHELVSIELDTLELDHGEDTTLWELFPWGGDGYKKSWRDEFGF